MIIDNQKIKFATGSSLPQAKRWSVAFLGPDPAGLKHSGVPRQYKLNDALKIALGGHLVMILRFKIEEAKQILTDIENWLKPRRVGSFEGLIDSEDDFIIHIIPSGRGHFLYDVKQVYSSEERPNKYEPEGPAAFEDGYIRYRFGDSPNLMVSTTNPREALPYFAPHFRVPISELIQYYGMIFESGE